MQRAPSSKTGQEEIQQGNPNCLQGLTFVITGILESLKRDEASDLIKKYGGSLRVTKGVNGKTSFLIAASDPRSTKMKRIEEKGVRM
mmetsp:Transcript_25997/g.41845  ORF Transcript_25997/g.41845 Transcript_25997/m.41845 type:complete len:87 (-) Transcript_25997:486-746(-)